MHEEQGEWRIKTATLWDEGIFLLHSPGLPIAERVLPHDPGGSFPGDDVSRLESSE